MRLRIRRSPRQPKDLDDLHERRLRKYKARGDKTFLLCSCDPADNQKAGFLPVVMHHSGDPILVSFVCIKCGSEIAVEGTYVRVDQLLHSRRKRTGHAALLQRLRELPPNAGA